MSSQTNDHQFCWERIIESRDLFRITHFFVPVEMADKLLALHALFASLDLLNFRVMEESIARTKLEWWRIELQSEKIKRSRHPILRYLNETGVTATLPGPALEDFLNGVELRLNAQSPTSERGFHQICRQIAEPRIDLECALTGLADQAALCRADSINGGLFELLRESSMQKDRAFWWVPLNLLARYKISRRELALEQNSDTARAVLRELMTVDMPVEKAADHTKRSNLFENPGRSHLQLTANLQFRVINRIQSMGPSSYYDELRRWRFSDVISTWNMARRIY